MKKGLQKEGGAGIVIYRNTSPVREKPLQKALLQKNSLKNFLKKVKKAVDKKG